jgi:hypothetical protein
VLVQLSLLQTNGSAEHAKGSNLNYSLSDRCGYALDCTGASITPWTRCTRLIKSAMRTETALRACAKYQLCGVWSKSVGSSLPRQWGQTARIRFRWQTGGQVPGYSQSIVYMTPGSRGRSNFAYQHEIKHEISLSCNTRQHAPKRLRQFSEYGMALFVRPRAKENSTFPKPH